MIEARILLAFADECTVRSVTGGIEPLLGFTANDLLSGRIRLQDRFHGEEAEIASQLFTASGKIESVPLHLRLRAADGRIRCIVAHAAKTAESSGAMLLDLLLQDARELCDPHGAAFAANFETLIDQTRDIVYVKDRNHVLLAASKALVNLTGTAQSRDDLLGRTDYDLFPEDMADISYRNEEKAFAEGWRVNQIVQATDRSGRRIWFDDRKYPLNDPDSNLSGLLGIAPDITVYVEAERELRKSEEDLKDAQRIASIGSYVTDIATGRWIASDSLHEVLGIDEGYDHSLAGWLSLVHPEDREKMAHFRSQGLEQRRPTFTAEYRIVRPKDQAVRWVQAAGRMEFDLQGNLTAMRGTIQDITGLKEAEAALREGETSLRDAQEIAGVGSFRINLGSRRWTASEQLLKIMGLELHPEERALEELIARIHPDEQEIVTARLERLFTGQVDFYDREYRIVRKNDGAMRWIYTRGRIERNTAGVPTSLHGTVQDITEKKQAEAALRESKELLQLFIEHAPAGLAMFDREMRYLAASRRWIEMHHLAGQEILGQRHYDIFPELGEEWKQIHRRALAGESIPPLEGLFTWGDGKQHWARREVRPWFNGESQVGGIVVFSEDITQQKEAEERLRLAASVFTHAAEGIAITDVGANILEINEAFTRITGYTRDEVLGKNPRLLQSGVQSPEFYENMWQSLLKNGQWSGEIWNKTKSGEIIAEELAIHAVRNAAGKVVQYVSHFSDVTQLKERERQLEHVAHYDALTGLPNRLLLADRLRQAMAQARRRNQFAAVAYLDLDGFKAINDTFGQEAGDNLLTAFAKRMSLALRDGDSLARLGGDEFAAVFLDLPDAEAARATAERLLKSTSRSVRIGARNLRVTASIGVAIYPAPDEPDADQLIRQAGQAMYQAKLAGRNRCALFDPGEDLSVQARSQELERIQQALMKKEFVLYFQPKVNMRTGTVIGAEALIRWQHPARGLLSPGQFLPTVENHPISIEIGEWVIDTALAQIEAWQQIGLDIPVSVNIAALQLQQKDFAERLRWMLAERPQVSPEKLELEVVETSALQDLAQTSSLLETCRNLGVSIAVDDFGTGYASLTYLKRLPVQTLKIDQSFVRDILDDPEDLSILEAVLGLATAFRREIVAEGVETVEHGLMLLHLGCELAQGYGIARPMPADEFPRWLATWRPDPRWFDAPPVHSGNRLLRFATVEHRAWLGAFEAYLQGKRHTPPPLDPHECRFSVWLDAERQAGRANLPAFQAIELLHEQLHGLTSEILNSQAGGPCTEGLARLSILHRMRDEFLDSLISLN